MQVLEHEFKALQSGILQSSDAFNEAIQEGGRMVHTKNYVYFANERISDFW
jgi:hypothetical protein